MRLRHACPRWVLGLPTSKEYYGGLTAPLVISHSSVPGGFRRCSQKRVGESPADGGLITHTKIILLRLFFLASP